VLGDAVEELDWSVGEITAALRKHGIDRKTLVFFSSDNGPWLIMGDQGGSAGPLREGKGSTWEGGMRVPGIAWWPGTITPRVTHEMASTMDLFSTALALAGAVQPPDVPIDGRDITGLLLRDESPPTIPFFYYRGKDLYACRLGNWKAHFVTQAGYGQKEPELHNPPILFHLGRDPGEQRDVAEDHQPVLADIEAAVAKHRADLVPGKPQF
jgi:arylsulfatase A-like enzyme